MAKKNDEVVMMEVHENGETKIVQAEAEKKTGLFKKFKGFVHKHKTKILVGCAVGIGYAARGLVNGYLNSKNGDYIEAELEDEENSEENQ